MPLMAYFSKVLIPCRLLKSKFGPFGNVIVRSSSLWEPDYLILGKTKTPEYNLINVQITGYDFAILENYQNFIRKIALAMKIDVVKSWPSPQKDLTIHHYKPNSTDVQYKYDLKLSERNVQVVDVKSNIMSLFIEAVLTACPPGVNISFHEHEDYMEDDRYVPNLEIQELQEQLENVGTVKKKKKPQ